MGVRSAGAPDATPHSNGKRHFAERSKRQVTDRYDVVVVVPAMPRSARPSPHANRAPRCSCWSVRPRTRRAAIALHRRADARRLQRRGGPEAGDAGSQRGRDRAHDFGTYTEDQFPTTWRASPSTAVTRLTEILVKRSLDTWLGCAQGRSLHRGWAGRRSTSGTLQVLGGLTVEAVGGGPGSSSRLPPRRARTA